MKNTSTPVPIYEFADIMDDEFIINIVKEYGAENQSIVLAEELNELLTEIIKSTQSNNNQQQLAEEISHCMISFCTYGYAYNLNWNANKPLNIKHYSSTDFVLLLTDFQKEIFKKMRGKNNHEILCEKIEICFSELQKCMKNYNISWDMIKEEINKKISQYTLSKLENNIYFKP